MTTTDPHVHIEDVHGERAIGIVRHLLQRAAAGQWTYLTEGGKRIAAVIPLDGPSLDHHRAQDGALSPTVTTAQDGPTDHGHAQ